MLPDAYCKQTVGYGLNIWLTIEEIESLLRDLPNWEFDSAPVLDEGRRGKFFVVLDIETCVCVRVTPRLGRPSSRVVRSEWRKTLEFDDDKPFFYGIKYSVFGLCTSTQAWPENFETISSHFIQLVNDFQAGMARFA